jgi:adenylate cyclase
VLDELRSFLLQSGAAPDDIARAEAEGWLPLLALDRLLVPGEQKYGVADLAHELDVDERTIRRLWRALGFPDVPPGLAVFGDEDLQAARRLLGTRAADAPDLSSILRIVRVNSASMSRIAAAESQSIADLLYELRDQGLPDDAIALELVRGINWEDIAALLDYSHRIQLRASLWRRLTRDSVPDLAIAVGFVDLSGYTELSSGLEPAELSELIGHWEEVAYDAAAACGTRVVKMIGDEVMFVGLAGQAARTALHLRDAGANDPALLPARGGVAAGPVVVRDGDFYGAVVNLASRLTLVAARGEVLAPASFATDVDDAAVRCEPAGARMLRSIGDVETCRLEWA